MSIVAKALELFIESLAVESFSFTSQSKKKTISKDDVFKAIDSVDSLAFLDGALDNWTFIESKIQLTTHLTPEVSMEKILNLHKVWAEKKPLFYQKFE